MCVRPPRVACCASSTGWPTRSHRRRVLTVVNKVPGLRYSSSEVADQLRSLCGDRIDVVASAPYDRRVVAAEWDAALPAAGPFTRALEPLAAAVTAATAVVSASGPAGATSTKGRSR